ncbi:transglycosylase SLT domain-containing protein [Dethiosulfovibrio sp. F2B]|uniref:transglycosylase SLT domain-containing protein n=1 Tax=Dethiosulfovibrio faecalis TaxID=2720018 RepID=UPI001F2703B1|nr:transglycosylase SLT domain-containing protein [Dethiosulfovibrio faecalis]MCF4150990.1 transglycosylase SLT domain-containing protein [Dethiosulfovibrio faecalis]
MDVKMKKNIAMLVLAASIVVVVLSLLKLELQGEFVDVDISDRFTRSASAFENARSRELYIPGSDTVRESVMACRTIIRSAAEESTVLASYIIGQNKKIPHSVAMEEAVAFLRYSSLYGVPLDIAVAVANTESHFNPQAESSHGSLGVMQVTWRVHRDLLSPYGFKSDDDLHDPSLGIKAGCILLSRYIKANDDLKTALGRYYGGSLEVYWRRISRNLRRYRKFEENRLK